MISILDCREAAKLITEAVDVGAVLCKVCGEISISKKTYNRWKNTDSDYIDKRMICEHKETKNKFTQEKRR